jgi:antibiotic biosynthesis monooxygenase (ABM) superfamily enzyme
MAIALFVVKATITAEQEAAFNDWYNKEHAPQVLQYRGAVSARRYKRIMGDEKYQYMAVYEFESEERFQEFLQSDHLKTLRREYDAHFGTTSERDGFGYVQIWP